MKNENNIFEEDEKEEKKQENPENNLQNNIESEKNSEKTEEKKEQNQENILKNEKIDEKKEINNSSSKIEIKKPIISVAERQNMIKKRNLMIKNSKYKPMKFMFGKKTNSLNLNNSVTETNPNINNTNIQINNYTTYLTTTESIKEEQYQKDGKTLMIENPVYYSMKQLNYKYKNDQLNKIMIIYIKKINELEDIYNFSNEYFSFIINLFENLSQPYISFLSNLFIERIKPNLKYFQNIIPIYQEFSLKLKILENSNKIDINNNPDANLINSVKEINILNADNLNEISNHLQNIILNNSLFIKLDTVESDFMETSNKMNLYLNKLKKIKNKFDSKYKNEMEPYFNGIKKSLNNISIFYDYLTKGKDFLFIEYFIMVLVNKILTEVSQLLINMDILFKSSHKKFCDYLELLNNLVKTFSNDQKNFINISSLLPKKLLTSLNSILNSNNIRKNIEKRFQFNKIIEKCVNFKSINDINHSLLNYRDNLIQSNYIKSEEIDEIINFNLINYDSSENFIQFLMRLIPERFTFKFNEMIELQTNIKKNSGLLKGYRDSLLIVTYQGHILLFDKDKKTEKIKKEMNNNKKMTRKELINSIIEEDDKNIEIKKDEKSDNNELYEAMANDKLTDIYIRKNFGMAKLSSNPNKKLMQFYENMFDFRQYRPIIVDLLSDNNMNNLIDVISKNKFW